MTRYRRNAAHFALLALTCAVGCGAPVSDEELIATEGLETGEEVAQKESDFIVVDGMYKNLMSLAHSSVRVCFYADLRGMPQPASNVPQATKVMVKDAILAWIDAARPASKSNLIGENDISFGCDSETDVIIHLYEYSGRAYVDLSNYIIYLYSNLDQHTVTHEFGHLFGLGDTYVDTEEGSECLPGQTGQIMCSSASDTPMHEDEQAIQEVYCINFPDKCTRRWTREANWCNHSSARLYVGDFDGNGQDELLCHDWKTGKKWIDRPNSSGHFNGNDWVFEMGWCKGENLQVFVGKFNDDNRDDLLCHDPATGGKWFSYANSSGEFVKTDWKTTNWCSHSTGELHIGDFNGDDQDDLLCHDTSNGSKWVTLADADGHFTGATWWSNFNWCGHASGELHIGDFNRDGRDDLLCHDTSSGRKWISFASTAGRFGSDLWEADLKWCNHAGGELHVGKFGYLGFTDLLCHDVNTGKKWVAMAFETDWGNEPLEGTSRYWDPGWCKDAATRLHVGNFDGQGTDDFLCHDEESGRLWTMYQF
jgi:FG-GAP-like repeat